MCATRASISGKVLHAQNSRIHRGRPRGRHPGRGHRGRRHQRRRRGAGRDGFTRPAASDSDIARAALKAVAAHPAAVRSGDRQAFTVTGALVDPDGTSHVRVARTYAGLPVLGGDLVVHRSAEGAWQGSSQSLTEDLALVVTPKVSQARAGAAAVAPSAVNRSITGEKVSSSRLVVDATRATPRLAYEVITGGTQKDGTPSRLASYVDAATGEVVRTEQQIETVDGSGQSLYGGTVPLQLTLSGSTYQLKDADPRQHLHHRHGQRDGLLRLPAARQRTATPGRCSPARTRPSATGRRAAASPQRSTRSTAPTRRGTTTRPPTAGTASSATARAPSTGCTTARTTSTPSGTAPR